MAQETAKLSARTHTICGAVNAGKTKLLDKIRTTNNQEGDAGSITQQIGTPYFKRQTLLVWTGRLNVTDQFGFLRENT